MHLSRRHIPAPLVLVMLVIACVLAVPSPASAAATLTTTTQPAIPDSYLIQGVPLYQQIQAVGCGAAALQMVLNYWGPYVDQKAVYDAARTARGTSLPDLARAGQFSSMSFTAGDRYPAAQSQGFPGRPLGYSGFFYAQTKPWIAQLEAVVAQGYPVIVLTDWLPGVSGPHYRVIVGYDRSKGVLILNDPWGREFKGNMGYQGTSNPHAAYDRQGQFVGWEWSYADFRSVWKLPTDAWGYPGGSYGAVLVAPWKVSVTTPPTVSAGSEFPVTVSVTYTAPAPFGTALLFPDFPAAQATLALGLPAGSSVIGQSTNVSLDTMTAGQTRSETIMVQAGAAGPARIDAVASGLVTGMVAPWRDYPGYSYADRIGGSASAAFTVTP
jgi:Peptidase_C39 like family